MRWKIAEAAIHKRAARNYLSGSSKWASLVRTEAFCLDARSFVHGTPDVGGSDINRVVDGLRHPSRLA